MGPGRTVRGTRRIVTTGLCIVTALTMALTTQAAAEPVPEPTATATATEPAPTPSPTNDPTPVPLSVTATTLGTAPAGTATRIWGTATGAPDTNITIQVIVNGAWANTYYGRTGPTGAYDLPIIYGLNSPATYTFRAVVTVDGRTAVSPSVQLTRTAFSVSAATAGSAIVGTPTRIWGTASGAPDTNITIQVIVNGAWANTYYGRTGPTGAYDLPITYGINTPGTYTFRALVTVNGRTAISPSVQLTRTAFSVSAATAGSATVGTATRIWGTASGAPNTRITIQVIVNGAWANTYYGTTSSTGAYNLPITYGLNTPGTYTFRALVTVNGRTAVSPSVRLTRGRLDPRCYTSGVVICASKSDRKVYYVKAGQILKTLDARFGGLAYDAFGNRRTYTTREGSFTVTRKVRNEVSYAYGNVPMPFSLYFYGAQAFHYSYGFASQGWVGSWGSHGCINLRDWSGAEWIFNNSSVGTRVVVYR